MAEAQEVFTTYAGLLCAHLTRTTGVLCAHGASLTGNVLFRQASTLVCHAYLFATLLLHFGSLHRPGSTPRVSESPRAQMQLARSHDHGAGICPRSMDTQS